MIWNEASHKESLNAGDRNEASQMALDWIKIAKCANYKLIA